MLDLASVHGSGHNFLHPPARYHTLALTSRRDVEPAAPDRSAPHHGEASAVHLKVRAHVPRIEVLRKRASWAAGARTCVRGLPVMEKTLVGVPSASYTASNSL